jgi:type IV secretory pathway TrbD component
VSEDDGSTHRRPVRRLLLGRGPLLRGSDRVQVLARALLAFVVLMALPVALAVATAVGTQTRAVADAQAASRQRVAATLVEDARRSSEASSYETGGATARATWSVSWEPGHEGVIDVPAGRRAGSTLAIWVDDKGLPTEPPLDGSDVVGRAVAHAVITFLGITTSAGLAYLAVQRAIDRSRMRRWAADWAIVEPVWSRKVR